MSEAYEGPLSGVKVVDVSQMLAAPFAAMLLADFGATVAVKVEPPQGEKRLSRGARATTSTALPCGGV